MGNNKQQDYYDEIEVTASKKDDLLQFLKEYEVSVYSNSDKGYDYLEDNDLMLIVKNPFCDETLDIELAGEFSLFFSGWHTHYFANEYYYEKMKKDIIGLLKGDIGAMIVTCSEKWLCSDLCREEISHLTDEIQLFEKHMQDEETIAKFIKHGGCIQVVYWNPIDTISFDVNSEDLISPIKFPRKNTVRFVVHEGQAIGSGSYKKYDDNTACLTYLWIEPSEEYDEKAAYEELYRVLEKDMIADGYKTIFAVCDEEESSFYKNNGYIIAEERDADRIIDLLGADVIHDMTMEKIIG